MKSTWADGRPIFGGSSRRNLTLVAGWVGALLLSPDVRAEAAKPDPSAAIGGGAVARVLPPAEKIKVLEDTLASESDRRVKAEEDNARRVAENRELAASAKVAIKERTALEGRLTETREREMELQKANDRLRTENERIAITVRLALPIVALVCAGILGLLIWVFLFLRQVAARVHGQRTLADMHELEAKLAHASGQLEGELKRNQTLRSKLAELGIVDDEAPRHTTGQWRAR
jgi:hypothetical protein